MRSALIHAGDTVEVDVRGLRFPALVQSKAGSHLSIKPLIPVGYRSATVRQVVRRLDPLPRKRRRAR